MKKIISYLERYPAALAAVFSVLAILFGFVAFVCFEMFEMYRPEVILNEHLATFALPIGILFLYFFIRCVSSGVSILMDLIKEKLHMQRSKH